jgi:serine/threonine protein kinase
MDNLGLVPEIIKGPRDAWHLLEPVGRGGTARTFKACRVSDDAIQLVKLLEVAHAADWKVIELFEREAAVLEAFEHVGTPRYIDHFALADGTRLVLVQELIAGRSLQAIIDSGASVSADRLEKWLGQALDILAALHARVPPIVHRDISPKNIIVDGDLLHLVDFGSVKAAVQSSTSVTGIGTFGFMPPEQVLGQAEPASDLYALGVTFACVAARAAPDALPFDRRGGRIDIGRIEALPQRLRPLLADLTHPALDRRCPDAATASERLRTAPTDAAAKPRAERPRAPVALALAPTRAAPSKPPSKPRDRERRPPRSRVAALTVFSLGMATMLVSGFVESVGFTFISLGLLVGGLSWTIGCGLAEQRAQRRDAQKAIARSHRAMKGR